MTFIHPRVKHSRNLIQEYYPRVELPDTIPCPIILDQPVCKIETILDHEAIEANNAFIIDDNDEVNTEDQQNTPDMNFNKNSPENDINQGNCSSKRKARNVPNVKRYKFKPSTQNKAKKEIESNSDEFEPLEMVQKLPNESDLDISIVEQEKEPKSTNWKSQNVTKTELTKKKIVSPTKEDIIEAEMDNDEPKINVADWKSKEQPKQSIVVVKPPEPISAQDNLKSEAINVAIPKIAPPEGQPRLLLLPPSQHDAVNPRLLRAKPKSNSLNVLIRAPENPPPLRPPSAPDNIRHPCIKRPGLRPTSKSVQASDSSYDKKVQDPVIIVTPQEESKSETQKSHEEIKSENKTAEKAETQKPEIEFVDADVIVKGATDQIENIISSKKISERKKKREALSKYTVSFESKAHMGMVRNYVRIFENDEPLYSLKTKKSVDGKEIVVTKGHEAHISSANKDGIIIVANESCDFSLREGSNIGTELVTIRFVPNGSNNEMIQRIFLHNMDDHRSPVVLTGSIEENKVNTIVFKDGSDFTWLKATFLGSNTMNVESVKSIGPMRCLAISLALFTYKNEKY